MGVVPDFPAHDVVVVGASAGGVEALRNLVASLPADYAGAIFVVLHVPSISPSVLPGILSRRGPLPAEHAVDGEPVTGGRIYVAPPDHHLLVDEGVVRVERGPRENGHRPAIDPLFRSAASTCGPRAIGIILSGLLDDGAAGLEAVTAAGGVAVVQDPEDALYPMMPESALAAVGPAAIVLPAAKMGQTLGELAGRPLDGAPTAGAAEPFDEPGGQPHSGRPSPYGCPECGGVLWELDDEGTRFRCRTGHAYSIETLLSEQGRVLETALWTALRALEEQSATAHRVASRLAHRGERRAAMRFEERASRAAEQANVVRETLELVGAVESPETEMRP